MLGYINCTMENEKTFKNGPFQLQLYIRVSNYTILRCKLNHGIRTNNKEYIHYHCLCCQMICEKKRRMENHLAKHVLEVKKTCFIEKMKLDHIGCGDTNNLKSRRGVAEMCECHICNVSMRRTNLKRHLENVHKTI